MARSDTSEKPVIIVGAGIGGLAAALVLARRGLPVVLCETQCRPGGKIHTAAIQHAGCDYRIDCGPTVFTMKPVFTRLFESVGLDFDRTVPTEPLSEIARHYWPDRPGESLSLSSDIDANMAAIAAFSGARDAAAYGQLAQDSAQVFGDLFESFMQAPRAHVPSLIYNTRLGGLPLLQLAHPFRSLWRELASRFDDVRLVQLFSRYATYCGASPFEATALLMLIIHAETAGVWRVKGGMSALAEGLAGAALEAGAEIRYNSPVAAILTAGDRASGVRLAAGDVIDGQSVIMNGDISALARLLESPAQRRAPKPVAAHNRSLSAVTAALVAQTQGPALAHHTVFFSADYEGEFAAIKRRECPADPTLYICAPQAGAAGSGKPAPPGSLFMIMNAPADGDRHCYSDEETQQWWHTAQAKLAAMGLRLRNPSPVRMESPSDFHQRFPASGGALYGRAANSPIAPLLRQGVRTRIKGLYCAGGSVHPSAGVPMAALSGWSAAKALMADWASTGHHRPGAISGGILTPSARTATGD